MNQPIDTLQEECLALLTDKLNIAEADRDEHRERADRAEGLCKPIRRAIAELKKAASKTSPTRSTKRCADKQEVLQLTRDTLQAGGAVPLADLKKSIANALRQRGRNLSMSAKLLAECLRTDEFEITEAGMVNLATSTRKSPSAAIASAQGAA